MNRNKIYHSAFALPAVATYAVFFILPVLVGIAFSFTNWNSIKLSNEVAKFVGLANYQKIFSDFKLQQIIWRTLYFGFVTTVLKNLIGFGLALLFHQGLKTKQALRTVFFLPSMLPPLIIGLIFGSLFMTNGFVNQLLTSLGFLREAIPWATTKETALGTVMFVEVWRQAGFNMVIFLAGLQLIDPTYYEAASIDGANALQKLKNITLPHMIAPFTINLILNLSQGLKAFDIVYVITGGGPAGSTELINTIVFKEYGKKLYGMSSAYGVIVFMITAFFSLLMLALANRKKDS